MLGEIQTSRKPFQLAASTDNKLWKCQHCY